ncbi:uncharacterized protein LOC121423529 [Lytechinus variegatus]|uniref:uncharacterized protein LOC121423529 n=1 Tax=Lytechinus variegatus TaxID=7654 RepID=UPI001BB20D6F|nr:uncharacterized protein LOC121423529 [Lytechinus variegatus]
MENPEILELTTETEQQGILQRRFNRPRRQPATTQGDQHTADLAIEMDAALAEGRATDAGTMATNQVAPTVQDNGDDGVVMEAGESTKQNLEQQLAATNEQHKDFKALIDAAKSLTGSTEDIPAGDLAKGLLYLWEEKQGDVRQMKAEIAQIQKEKDHTQETLKTIEDQLSELRKDRVFKACKKHQRKWWRRFCLCGVFKKNNKVGVAPDEDDYLADWETNFADEFAKQNSTIRSLQKEKAILEIQISKLKDKSEATTKMVKEMAQKHKEMEKGRKEAEKQKKKIEGEKAKAERLKGKAERDKDKVEKRMMEMEKKMKEAERKKKEYVERINRAVIEKLSLMKQEIDLKNEEISQLNKINGHLQTITDIKIMRERRTTIDRVVSACLYIYTPKELSSNDLMSFNQSSGPVMLDVVGTGGFGEVMIGRLNGEKNPVAVKRALVTQNLTADQQDLQRERRNIRFEKEARAGLVMSDSPYFPRFLGIVLMNGDQCLVTEFIGDKIQGKPYPLYYAIFPEKGCDPEPKMKEWNLAAIGEDVIRGIMDLHDRSLLHNDLKDDNVLLEFRQNRWVGVIIDLGMMSTMSYPHFSGSNMSTNERAYFVHTAPEVLNGGQASVASDIFSVGYILDCIGRFIKDDDLRKLGGMCCEEDPKDRPANLGEVLPGVVDIKEKHKTVARLAGELIEDDTDEEEGKGVDEDEDFLTEEESQGEEGEEGGHQSEGEQDGREHQGLEDGVLEEEVEEDGHQAEGEEGDREHQVPEDDVQEEGQIEEGGVEAGEEIDEEGIEGQGGDGIVNQEGGDRLMGQLVGEPVEEEGNGGEDILREEAPHDNELRDIAVGNGMPDVEGQEIVEVVHLNVMEADHGRINLQRRENNEAVEEVAGVG